MIKARSWECMSYSFCMALGMTPAEFYATIGHNGSDIIFPGLPDPMCRRGVHVNECVHVALWLGYSVTPFQLVPVIAANNGRRTFVMDPLLGPFDHWINTTRGVLEGDSHSCRHAVAYDRGMIYDPDGGEPYPWSIQECESRGFYGKQLWIVNKLRHD